MKKQAVGIRIFVSAALAVILCLSTVPAALADSPISLYLNGDRITPQDANGKAVPILAMDGTTYLPVRALGKALGVTVDWDAATNTVSLGHRRTDLKYTDGIKVYIDGNLIRPTDVNGRPVAPFAREGTTYLPVRAVAEALKLEVEWDQAGQAVRLWSSASYGEEVYRLVYVGDWDNMKYPELFREKIRAQFERFPAVMARFGATGRESRSILLTLDEDEPKNQVYTRLNTGFIVCARNFLNANSPTYTSYYIHELAHVTQNYGSFDSHWWDEHLANYIRFRYYLSTDPEEMEGFNYSGDDPKVRDWGWAGNPYGACEWFFTYLDSKYPTHMDEDGNVAPGLIDTLHQAIKDWRVRSDGDSAMTDGDFNATVKSVTGFDSFEELRKQYVRDLDSGAWEFSGFDGMEDSFLTENADEPVEIFEGEDDLLMGAEVVECSDARETAANVTDRSFRTCWAPDSLRLPYVIFDLGETRTFDTYSLFSGASSVNDPHTARSWDILVSNDMESWTVADSRRDVASAASSYYFAPATGRYVMFRLTDGAKYHPQIYSLMLFNTGSGRDAPVETWEENGAEYTGVRRDGLIRGVGRMATAEGTYVGDFENGVPQGAGRYISAENGRLDIGSWFMGQRHGWCEEHFANGDRLLCVYDRGSITGRSWLVGPVSGVYETVISGGEVVSQGPAKTETWTVGGVTYTGCRINGLLEGPGTFVSSVGTYTGMTAHGDADGEGTFTWANGQKFVGVWDHGTAYGVLYNLDGTSRDYVI